MVSAGLASAVQLVQMMQFVHVCGSHEMGRFAACAFTTRELLKVM